MSTVYQHSTLAALMGKVLGGSATLAELKEHGDTGIGTFDGLDGEMIMANGEVYYMDGEGTIHHVTDMAKTVPFATVHHASDSSEKVKFSAGNMKEMVSLIDDRELQNTFSGVILQGSFAYMKVRSAPKSERPYPSLSEITKTQREFEETNISGTLIGYYSPELYQGTVAAGWHVHFLSDDRTFGGHVLGFDADKLEGDLTIFDNYELHLPIDNKEFREHHVDMDDLKEGVAAAEGSQD
ncbi:acetolactate decarboxylase [Weissella paramesenteroides]|uniref:acetolactate decarboxylase n=1 Tax=Weissella paramesenteroides TaxID=1249 RepID=UPI003F1FE502